MLTFEWKSVVPRPVKAETGTASKTEETEKLQKQPRSNQSKSQVRSSLAEAGDITSDRAAAPAAEGHYPSGAPASPAPRGDKADMKTTRLQSGKAAVISAQLTLESAQAATDKGQTVVDTARVIIHAEQKTDQPSGNMGKTGQRAIQIGGWAAKQASCCSHKSEEDSDEDQDTESSPKEGGEENVEDYGEGSDGKKEGNDDKEYKDKENEKKTKDIWKDRTFLEIACDESKDKVAAEVWKLGNTLLKNRVISVPDVVWSQTKDSGDVKKTESVNCGSKLRENAFQDSEFVIHPDLTDDYRQQNFIAKLLRFVSLFSTSIPDSWKSVNQRRALEANAMLRVGFVFSAYKVNFWYWEMIEMTRK